MIALSSDTNEDIISSSFIPKEIMLHMFARFLPFSHDNTHGATNYRRNVNC